MDRGLTRLGLNIKALRKKKGMSQLKLSLRAGVSKTYLSELERGKRNPSVLLLGRLAEALGAPLKSFFE